MKISLTGICILFLLHIFFNSCDNQQNRSDNKSANDSSQSKVSSGSSTPDNAHDTQTGNKPSEPVIGDSSNQNYTFSTSGELQITGDEYKYDINLPTDVLFDFDKADLRPEGIQLLQNVKQHFQKHKADQVHIWGHTDSKGSDQYNFVLSQKRAKAVCDWLNKEVGGFNMCIGKGEVEPLVPNENPDGSDNAVNRQKNRRVTISVVKYPDVNKMLDKGGKDAEQ